jgi:Mn-dependent DtxR family transcriptional regulator
MIIWPTKNETEVLAILLANGETMNSAGIVDELQALIKPTSMRGVLERMERKGLIVKLESGDCELTELGRRIAEIWTEFGGGPATGNDQ